MYIKDSGDTAADLAFCISADAEIHTEEIRIPGQVDIRCPQVRPFLCAKGPDGTEGILCDLFKMRVIQIGKSLSGLPEQHGLTCHVFFKILMFVRPDMIRREIGEQAVIEFDTCSTIQLKALGRSLHNNTLAACIHHLSEIAVNVIGFRSGIVYRDMLISDDNLYGPDHTGLQTDGFQKVMNHISGCGLSLGSGDSYGFQLPCRITEPCSRDQGHSLSGVFHLNDRHALRGIHPVLDYQNRRTGICCLGGKFMTIEGGTLDTKKKASLFQFTAVVHNRSHIHREVSLQTSVFQLI